MSPEDVIEGMPLLNGLFQCIVDMKCANGTQNQSNNYNGPECHLFRDSIYFVMY